MNAFAILHETRRTRLILEFTFCLLERLFLKSLQETRNTASWVFPESPAEFFSTFSITDVKSVQKATHFAEH